MKGFLNTDNLRVCNVLEKNYNIILDEYNKFKFDVIIDNSSDENWDIWKYAHEISIDMARKEYKDVDWEKVTFAPYKTSHSLYGLIVNEKSVWDGALIATSANKECKLKITPIANRFFSETFNLLKDFDEITTVMIARFPPKRELPLHRGFKEILRTHMGLIVPDGDIGFSVSKEKKKWENGKCLAFNDFSEHYAWNNTDVERINIIVDLDRRKVNGSK